MHSANTSSCMYSQRKNGFFASLSRYCPQSLGVVYIWLSTSLIASNSRPVHEPIISRKIWEDVQKTLGNTKRRKPKHVSKHILTGFLKCADCGANLNYKYTHDNPDNHYFSCRNNRANNGLCKKTHHICVDAIEKIVIYDFCVIEICLFLSGATITHISDGSFVANVNRLWERSFLHNHITKRRMK